MCCGCYNTTTMKVLHWLLFLLLMIGLLLIVQPADTITSSFVQRAAELESTVDYASAAAFLRLALVRQPWNAALYLRLAETLAAQRDEAGAEQAWQQAQALGVDAAIVVAQRAAFAEQSQQTEVAAGWWEQAVAARPADQDAVRRLIAAYVRDQRWNEARTAAEQWAARWPSSADAHLKLAQLLAVDDPIAARDHLRQAQIDKARPYLTALDQPDAALRLQLLGRVYLNDNETQLAQRAFQAAIAANPNYAEAYAYSGFMADQLGGDGRALLDRAVEVDRDLVVARYFRAWHWRQRGDLDRAESDLLHAIELDPANAAIAAELGRVYTQRSNYAEAEKWLLKARDLQPRAAEMWTALAELYVGRSYGTPDQMLATAQQIVNLTPDDAEAHVWLGRAYLLTGDRGGAERELTTAARLNPRSAAAHLYLGRLFGRSTEAGRIEYERAQALDPDGPIGLAAKRALELP